MKVKRKSDILGRQMKAVRLERKLTQAQMAQMLNIRPEQYCRIEKSASYTTLDVIIHFCKLFDCEIIIKHE